MANQPWAFLFSMPIKEDDMTQKLNARKTNGSAVRLNRDPVRVTALWYLKEALLEERYEECAEIIAIAYEFGARESEVEGLLEDPRRNP